MARTTETAITTADDGYMNLFLHDRADTQVGGSDNTVTLAMGPVGMGRCGYQLRPAEARAVADALLRMADAVEGADHDESTSAVAAHPESEAR
jgi:hypothetical protein